MDSYNSSGDLIWRRFRVDTILPKTSREYLPDTTNGYRPNPKTAFQYNRNGLSAGSFRLLFGTDDRNIDADNMLRVQKRFVDHSQDAELHKRKYVSCIFQFKADYIKHLEPNFWIQHAPIFDDYIPERGLAHLNLWITKPIVTDPNDKLQIRAIRNQWANHRGEFSTWVDVLEINQDYIQEEIID